MKKTKTINAITGVLLLVYAFIQGYIYILSMKVAELSVGQLILNGEIEKVFEIVLADPTAAELQPLQVLGYVSLFAGAFAIVLFVLGIIALVWNVKDQSKGRTVGIFASILCVSGFIVGWISLVNIIIIVLNASVFFLSFYQYETATNSIKH